MTTEPLDLSQPWPSVPAEYPILLVCGFGRCGTSLVMQMLAAGGIPVTGRGPSHEEMPPGAYRHNADFWRSQYSGRAIKVLDPAIRRPPAGLNYRVIWLERDFWQQALSQIKLLQVMEGMVLQSPLKVAAKKFEKINRSERPRNVAFLHRLAGPENCQTMRFEELINAPHIAAQQLWSAYGALSTLTGLSEPEIVTRMGAVARFRHSDNYPGMLELKMEQMTDAL